MPLMTALETRRRCAVCAHRTADFCTVRGEREREKERERGRGEGMGEGHVPMSMIAVRKNVATVVLATGVCGV